MRERVEGGGRDGVNSKEDAGKREGEKMGGEGRRGWKKENER
jgi:hypothetical protein